ncbi:MAG: hypothetical protein JW806_03465 [Sedimentisphaerales bacterium]|nr:hypothetical protein [Sedimentisphaerales bacterium]
MKRSFLLVSLFLISCSSCFAVPLSDVELYFDPATITPDYYTKIYLEDLAMQNTVVWDANTDPVIDADILPILNEGTYTPFHVYSPSDYYHTPGIDYSADLTAGTLTATFSTPGVYHVRVTRASAASEIFCILAESYMVVPDDTPSTKKTTKTKKVPMPDADLFVSENRDSATNNCASAYQKAGKTVKRASNQQGVIDEIKARSEALGRKIHVELNGHGVPGSISTGVGDDPNHRICFENKNVASFQKSIDKYVNHITFQGCSVGKGEKGKRFLQIMADSIGKAGAWSSDLWVIDANYFAIETPGEWVEVVVKDKKDIQYNIPVVINCVGNTDCNDIEAKIKAANKKLKKANIKLHIKKVNKNVNVGNGDDEMDINEIMNAPDEAKKELKKILKDKKGKWTGKGLKIYVAKKCWKEQPTKDNWMYGKENTLGINSGIDANTIPDIIKKKFDPEDIYDPNCTDKQKAEMAKEAKVTGHCNKARKKKLEKKGNQTTADPAKTVAAQSAKLDDLYDMTGPIDPCNHMYAYTDIHSIGLTSSDLSDPDGQTIIRVWLNGVFPGIEPALEPNPSRLFTSHMLFDITNGLGMGTIHAYITNEPDGVIKTQSWYEGPASGMLHEPVLLDNVLTSHPNEPDDGMIRSNVIELLVSNSLLIDNENLCPSSLGQLCEIMVNYNTEDSGLVIQDIAEDIESGPVIYHELTMPHETKRLYLIEPSDMANGRSLGVSGSGFEPLTEIAVTMDSETEVVEMTAMTNELGEFICYFDPAEPIEMDTEYAVDVTQIIEGVDECDVETIGVDFEIETPLLAGDLNEDDIVNFEDLAIMADNWLASI